MKIADFLTKSNKLGNKFIPNKSLDQVFKEDKKLRDQMTWILTNIDNKRKEDESLSNVIKEREIQIGRLEKQLNDKIQKAEDFEHIYGQKYHILCNLDQKIQTREDKNQELETESSKLKSNIENLKLEIKNKEMALNDLDYRSMIREQPNNYPSFIGSGKFPLIKVGVR